MTATHAVENQPPPFVDANLFAIDLPLIEGLTREGGAWGAEAAAALGARVGSAAYAETIRKANAWLPQLRTHDRFGNRIDEVEFADAWHELMTVAKGAGLVSIPWREAKPGAHVVRAALHYIFGQGEQGPSCPIAMTFAAVPALRHQPEIANEWVPRLLDDRYDRRFIPASGKTGALMGMAMTEKQGGSDVRANTTRASPASAATGPGAEYTLTGHKWFCSAPMCDAFLTLAHTEKGLSCFFVPRFLPDGARNVFRIQRLKDKLGNKTNASSEIEYDGTWARMVGPEGRGVSTIIDMVHHTRLECIIGSAAYMRAAFAQAMHHVSYRRAFQRRLVDQPLMRSVVADLAVECEATVALMLRVARAFDQAKDDALASSFARIATPIAKYWICKRVSQAVLESLECFGGNGYVEEGPMARLYRDSPLNGIWEGSGNVICLDVLRALDREPGARDVLLAELATAKGGDRNYDSFVAGLVADLERPGGVNEPGARLLVERLAVALQAALLLRHAPPAVADIFCATRLAHAGGLAYGALPPGAPVDAVIERARFAE